MSPPPIRAHLVGPVIGPLDYGWLRRRLRLPCDLVVAIDGGLDVCRKLGIHPDIAVGDWDSLSIRSALKKVLHLTLPVKKDLSDLAATLRVVQELGVTELVAFGVTRGRADQHLASLLELTRFSSRLSVSAIDPQAEYYFLGEACRERSFRVARDQTVSLFSWIKRAKGVSTSGLFYPLKNANLEPSSLGLSNRAKSRRVEVRLKSGKLMVVIPIALR